MFSGSNYIPRIYTWKGLGARNSSCASREDAGASRSRGTVRQGENIFRLFLGKLETRASLGHRSDFPQISLWRERTWSRIEATSPWSSATYLVTVSLGIASTSAVATDFRMDVHSAWRAPCAIRPWSKQRTKPVETGDTRQTDVEEDERGCEDEKYGQTDEQPLRNKRTEEVQERVTWMSPRGRLIYSTCADLTSRVRFLSGRSTNTCNLAPVRQSLAPTRTPWAEFSCLREAFAETPIQLAPSLPWYGAPSIENLSPCVGHRGELSLEPKREVFCNRFGVCSGEGEASGSLVLLRQLPWRTPVSRFRFKNSHFNSGYIKLSAAIKSRISNCTVGGRWNGTDWENELQSSKQSFSES